MTPPTQDDLAVEDHRRLDAEVAEKVMGWRLDDGPVEPHLWHTDGPDGMNRWWHSPPRYSTDIGSAWQIVEWAEASPRGWKLTLMRSGRSLPDYQWICTFHRGHVELARVVEQEAPLAICKAALRAVSAG